MFVCDRIICFWSLLCFGKSYINWKHIFPGGGVGYMMEVAHRFIDSYMLSEYNMYQHTSIVANILLQAYAQYSKHEYYMYIIIITLNIMFVRNPTQVYINRWMPPVDRIYSLNEHRYISYAAYWTSPAKELK